MIGMRTILLLSFGVILLIAGFFVYLEAAHAMYERDLARGWDCRTCDYEPEMINQLPWLGGASFTLVGLASLVFDFRQRKSP
jgi:uncharacterized membrane protein HdeD (DUF308 family)